MSQAALDALNKAREKRQAQDATVPFTLKLTGDERLDLQVALHVMVTQFDKLFPGEEMPGSYQVLLDRLVALRSDGEVERRQRWMWKNQQIKDSIERTRQEQTGGAE